MKWKHPSYGDRRVRKHFCLFPVVVEGHKVWLESVYVVEVYTDNLMGAGWWPLKWYLSNKDATTNVNSWFGTIHESRTPPSV